MTDRIIVMVVTLMWNITTYKLCEGPCSLVLHGVFDAFSTAVLFNLSQVQST